DFARVRHLLEQGFHERRLAGAVEADQRRDVPAAQRGVDPLEDVLVAQRDVQAADRDQVVVRRHFQASRSLSMFSRNLRSKKSLPWPCSAEKSSGWAVSSGSISTILRSVPPALRTPSRSRSAASCEYCGSTAMTRTPFA